MQINVKDLNGNTLPCVMVLNNDTLDIMINTPVLFELDKKNKKEKAEAIQKTFTKEEISKLAPHMGFFLEEISKETFVGELDLHKIYLKEKSENIDKNDPQAISLLNKRYMSLILKLI